MTDAPELKPEPRPILPREPLIKDGWGCESTFGFIVVLVSNIFAVLAFFYFMLSGDLRL